ncbi:hypothetical protein V2H26_08265 [Xanthomonas euvesicatoria]|uniref:hypothetical protein n=1 Tax=Xanthomonas citri TaxID=346 RepID=UPI000F810DEB|nr:hypothetical protein [Xanthomonas axonopodis]MEE5090057.1 hypothetical protein [Xanthomonas euvesicatoria]RTE58871.1 hypothetical protein EI541_06320 [Xanthomonas axonopodis pv. eucalyptorum]
MHYKTNAINFMAAANAAPAGSVEASYCRLVAVELSLKLLLNSSNHDIPKMLNRLVSKKPYSAASSKSHANALIVKINSVVGGILVNDKQGKCISARASCFPDLRYARNAEDGWVPSSSAAKIAQLSSLSKELVSFLEKNI